VAKRLVEAIRVIGEPQTAPNVRQQANQYVLDIEARPEAIVAALELCKPSYGPMQRLFAFGVIGKASQKGRLNPQDPSTEQVRNMLLDMFVNSHLSASGNLQDVPSFVCEKYMQALANVALYSSSWPQGWEQLQPNLFQVGRGSRTHATLALTFFRNVSEALQSDDVSTLGAPRRKSLQQHLKASSQDLFQFLAGAVVSWYPGAPELERAALLLITELAGVLTLKNFLAADVDSFVKAKLSSPQTRGMALEALTELLAKDVAKDLKELPEKSLALLKGIVDLTGCCQASAQLSGEEYEIHRGLAVLMRDFVECNKPSMQQAPPLQALLSIAASNFLKYPAFSVQYEAASILPHLLRAAFEGPASKGKVAEAGAPVPPWLRVKEELGPLLILCAHRRVTPEFPLFALPQGYVQALQVTCEFDAEEDLPGVQLATKGRLREILAALLPCPSATTAILEYMCDVLPPLLSSTNVPANFLAYEATLSLLECLWPNVKVKSGPQALQALRKVLTLVLKAPSQSPEQESKRLECLARSGGAFEELAEGGGGCADEVITFFQHVFKVVETSTSDLRKRALLSCTAVCKAAPNALRPVLQAVVEKAVALLQSVPEDQYILCEALVAASTAAQNFEMQQSLLQSLLGPLASQFSALATSLGSPEKLIARLLANDRSELQRFLGLLQCLEAAFGASTVPSRPAAAQAGGFCVPDSSNPEFVGVLMRNPAANLAATVLPGLAAVFRAFHAAFPSDGSRSPAGVTQASQASALQWYLFGLDNEEVRALTSSLDTKRNDEGDAWTDPLPPPAGPEASRILEGRQLLYNIRSTLYKCAGAILGVQDGVLTHPEIASIVRNSFLDALQGAHPYHIELQLRTLWMVPFSPSGLSQTAPRLRSSFAAAALPQLLTAAAAALQRSWARLQSDANELSRSSGGFVWTPALLSLLCTGTVMASRTFVELVAGLIAHGNVPGSTPSAIQQQQQRQAANSNSASNSNEMSNSGGGGANDATKAQRKKGKDRIAAAAATAGKPGGGGKMSDDTPDNTSKVPLGYAGSVFTQQEVLKAVQSSLLTCLNWPDPKALAHSLSTMQSLGVRLMSGGETHQSLKEFHTTQTEAPGRCNMAVEAVLQPLLGLCARPPAAPAGDSALHTTIGKPYADFFTPEKSRGNDAPSPCAEGLTSALWPIFWGMSRIFLHICKTNNIQASSQTVMQFQALAQAFRLLTALPKVTEADVQSFLTVMLESAAEMKTRRGALRYLVRTGLGETSTGLTLQ